MTYPILKLPYDDPTQLEQLGTKAKFWFRDQHDCKTLFKEGRPGTGENWAEKVCCEICGLLDIPHANYDLAVWKDCKGVASPTFVPANGRLVCGNELLAKIIDDYQGGNNYKSREHKLRTVMAVLGRPALSLPLDWNAPASIKDAAGVFVGYLMLDALVSNQDRHHENWGVIVIPGQGVYFAPTFDHASSLGRNETDAARIEMLSTKDRGRSVEAYVGRALSAIYATPPGKKPMSTLEAFTESAKICPEAAEYWVGKLSAVNPEQFRIILDQIPDTEISAPARDFACRMLELNRKKILERASK